jgi:aspartate aminotransferase
MLRFTQRTSAPVSPIRKIFVKIPEARERLKQQGKTLIDLSIGQPHIAPNPEVIRRIESDEKNNAAKYLGYTSSLGEDETLDAIVRLYKSYYPLVNYDKTQVMVTNGASGALSNVFSALVEKSEDVILTFEGFFGAYTGQIAEWEGSLKMIPTHQHAFRPTAAGLRQALQNHPTTRALILNYPNNPTGVSLRQDEIQDLAAVLKDYPDVWIIIDDVYRDFNHQKHLTLLDVFPEFKDRCIVINSGAKGLIGAPGYRIGMIATHSDLIKAMLPRQINGLASVPHATQRALVHAANVYLENPNNDWLVYARNEYKNNVAAATVAFNEKRFKIAAKPEGAFYLLVDASQFIGQCKSDHSMIENDVDIASYLLEVAGVAVVPASGFGIDTAKGYLRVSCANESEQLIEAAARMHEAMQLLQEPSKRPRLNTH